MFRFSSALALCALGLFTTVGRAQTTPAVSTILALSQSSPVGNLVKGADGALYGTSATSTSLTGGLIYRSTVDGSDVRTLYQLTADDAVSPGSGLTLAGDGLLYGTTRFGKSGDVAGAGTVFRISPDGTGFQIIFRFAPITSSNTLQSPINTNGAYPEAELTEGDDGYLYGTARTGGPQGTGTVFKLSKDGTDFQLLKSFGAVIRTLTGFGGAEAAVVSDPTNAANIVARVAKSATAELSAGVTVSTGANNTVGTIPFTATSTRMTVRVYSPRAGIPVRLKVEDAADPTHSVETEALTTLVNTWETLTFDFANQVAGTAALNLAYTYNRLSIFFDYGKTGAAGGGGTFYFDDVLFDTSGGGGGSSFKPITFALACGLTLTVDGAGPAGPLVPGDDGLFYGTTSAGGPDGCGTIFRIGFDGTGFQVLHEFSATTKDATTGQLENPDGAAPQSGLADGGDGFFYGTTSQGGVDGYGVLFAIPADGSTFTVLHAFNNTNGARPSAELMVGGDGKLYGTTSGGGVNSSGATTTLGTLFSIDRAGTNFARLYSFDGASGSTPGSRLLELSSGVFVGTAGSGGSCGFGTLYRYSAAGDTVTGNTRCGRRKNNNSGGGSTGFGVLLLLGGLAWSRRRFG